MSVRVAATTVRDIAATIDAMSRRRDWITAVVVWVVVWAALAIPVGTFVYIHFIKEEAPAAFKLDETPTTTAVAGTATPPAGSSASSDDTGGASADSSLDGSWTIGGTPSTVGYRVVEVLFGQNTDGVGRTNAVTGQLELAGAQVTTASFSVDMTTVKSDESRRDRQFDNNLMDVSQFPTATFELTAPIELGGEPADGQAISAKATGNLTLRGTTKAVTVDVQAKRTGDTFQVVGSTPIVFADYGIPKPNAPGITTEDHGLLEFDLHFTKA
jgi:polyisoprenoid-binding protein YceI